MVHQTDAEQECSSCSGIQLFEVCHNSIKSNNDETCYMHQYSTKSDEELFDLGCVTSQGCSHSLQPIFGKRAEGHHLKCMACCNDTALCNKNLKCKGNASLGVALPKDCPELVLPHYWNGSYTIYPYGVQYRPVSAYRVFDGDGHWTVIQRRVDGSVVFNHNWDAYKKGFGYSNGDFWLGNDVIHELTHQSNHELKLVLTEFANVTYYLKYKTFNISDEYHGYRLFLTGYSGTVCDCLGGVNGTKFSTYDKINDIWSSKQCAITFNGAWWDSICDGSNLNGPYIHGNQSSIYTDGIEWSCWAGQPYLMKETTMMIKGS